MNNILLFFLIQALIPSIFSDSRNMFTIRKTGKTEWIISDLLSCKSEDIRISGNPEMTESKFGRALLFDGIKDGIFVDSMPLKGLDEFTVEAIFCPFSGANREQRFFHCGEIQGDRILMELRSTAAGWFFDAFVKSGDQNITLADTNLLHPSDRWYHVAFVVSPGKQETYVNGTKELEGHIKVSSFRGGKTSVGVRLNEQSWFKGAIYKIRITPEALQPDKFMNFK